jgi:hypothetical protein
MKHSSFRDSHIKSNTSRDSEEQKERATGNVLLILRTLIMTRSDEQAGRCRMELLVVDCEAICKQSQLNVRPAELSN